MDTKKRTITLTDRKPVTIVEDQWPELASASYYDYDGQYDFQSFRHWRAAVRVRQHADGRAIVYAIATHETVFPGEREYAQRAGELLSAEQATTAGIVAAIKRVHADIDIVDEDHTDQWRLLADECIANLPAEALDSPPSYSYWFEEQEDGYINGSGAMPSRTVDLLGEWIQSSPSEIVVRTGETTYVRLIPFTAVS